MNLIFDNFFFVKERKNGKDPKELDTIPEAAFDSMYVSVKGC